MESIGGSFVVCSRKAVYRTDREMLPGQKRRHAVNFMYVSIERKRK